MDAIRKRFNDNLLTGGFVIEYDNDKDFTKPGRGLWGRLVLLPGEKFVVGKGSPGADRYRLPGEAVLQIFAPAETGMAGLWTKVDQVMSFFQGVTAAGVTYRTPRPVNVGRDGKWQQVNVHCPWYADDIA
jgi:hypothetical protein